MLLTNTEDNNRDTETGLVYYDSLVFNTILPMQWNQVVQVGFFLCRYNLKFH